ncbi:hypothetical protein E2C01_010526 [Portunus trituberculatus]|uniref:Uncharacterized protein n=1 Tax=Portunus trituberculatus TaxID=210409 RepID=A0A5B7D8X6_PORTR|nr:hypothetical protein [Portunus trituberculatus]
MAMAELTETGCDVHAARNKVTRPQTSKEQYITIIEPLRILLKHEYLQLEPLESSDSEYTV